MAHDPPSDPAAAVGVHAVEEPPGRGPSRHPHAAQHILAQRFANGDEIITKRRLSGSAGPRLAPVVYMNYGAPLIRNILSGVRVAPRARGGGCRRSASAIWSAASPTFVRTFGQVCNSAPHHYSCVLTPVVSEPDVRPHRRAELREVELARSAPKGKSYRVGPKVGPT
jgi:hypothetical protein